MLRELLGRRHKEDSEQHLFRRVGIRHDAAWGIEVVTIVACQGNRRRHKGVKLAACGLYLS
jgi:hypothetical protein